MVLNAFFRFQRLSEPERPAIHCANHDPDKKTAQIFRLTEIHVEKPVLFA
jgi:hypothetical protein